MNKTECAQDVVAAIAALPEADKQDPQKTWEAALDKIFAHLNEKGVITGNVVVTTGNSAGTYPLTNGKIT